MKKEIKRRQINFKANEIDMERLKKIADKYEISMSAAIRFLIKREYENLALLAKANILTDK